MDEPKIINNLEEYSKAVSSISKAPKEPKSYPCAIMKVWHDGMGYMEATLSVKIACCPDWVDDQYAFLEGVVWAWQNNIG